MVLSPQVKITSTGKWPVINLHFNRFGGSNVQLAYRNNLNEGIPTRWNDIHLYIKSNVQSSGID